MPGKTIKFLAPLAHKIHVCFEESKNYLPAHKCTVKNYPIRFAPELKKQSQTEARQKLGLDPHKKTIFVLGGSQGSLFINGLIKDWIIKHDELAKDIQLIHQTGARDTTDWQAFYKQHNVRALVFDYHEQIATLYTSADTIVCRAGAGTLFEVAFFNKHCITIPLEATTTNHQVANGHAMARLFPDRFTCLEQKVIKQNSNILFMLLNKVIKERS